jgi:hypothetical protein
MAKVQRQQSDVELVCLVEELRGTNHGNSTRKSAQRTRGIFLGSEVLAQTSEAKAGESTEAIEGM